MAEARPEKRLRHGAPADVAHADHEDLVEHAEIVLYVRAGAGVKVSMEDIGGLRLPPPPPSQQSIDLGDEGREVLGVRQPVPKTTVS
jgi:hypothetical protein